MRKLKLMFLLIFVVHLLFACGNNNGAVVETTTPEENAKIETNDDKTAKNNNKNTHVKAGTYIAKNDDKGFKEENINNEVVTIYVDNNGNKLSNSWLELGDNKYYFDDNAQMAKDVITINDKEYGFDIDGKLRTDDFNYMNRHYILNEDNSIKDSTTLSNYQIKISPEYPIGDILEEEVINPLLEYDPYIGLNDEQIAMVNSVADKFYNNYILNKIEKDTPDWKFRREVETIRYFVDNMQYDIENYNNHTIPDIDYTAYGALVNNLAVCNGFSNAFIIMCRKCDIKVTRIVGQNHAWNMVELDDGEWYYVDTTWNICEGTYTKHTNFNDESANATRHYTNLITNQVYVKGIEYSGEYTSKYLMDKYKIDDTRYEEINLYLDEKKENTYVINGKEIIHNNGYNDKVDRICYYYLDNSILHLTNDKPSEDHLIYGTAYVGYKLSEIRHFDEIVTDIYIHTPIKVNNCASIFSFKNLKEIININYLNTSEANDFSYMFSGCYKLKELDLNSFDTHNATKMCGMFYSCISLKRLKIDNFDTSKVTDMSKMFNKCENLENIDISNFNTQLVEDFSEMFLDCQKLKSFNIQINTKSAKNYRSMFSGCKNLISIDTSVFDTNNAEDFSTMFNSCKKLESIDLSNFYIKGDAKVDNMLSICNNLKNIKISESLAKCINQIGLEGDWKSKSNNKIYRHKEENIRFTTLPNISGGYEKVELKYKQKEKVISKENIIYWYIADNVLYLSGTKPDNIKWTEEQQYETFLSPKDAPWYSYRSEIEKIVINNKIKPKDCRHMFANLVSLKSIEGMENLDTKGVKFFANMFGGDTNLTEVDLTHMNTDSATSMFSMFSNCQELKRIDISNFNMANVKNVAAMFAMCSNLESIGVTDINLPDGCEFERIFFYCFKLKGATHVDKYGGLGDGNLNDGYH